MRVVVLHQAVSEEGTVDEKDVFDQLGAADLELEPGNPDSIYVCMWRGERRPWTIISGGFREGGIYKSTDAGATFNKLAGGQLSKRMPSDKPSRTPAERALTGGELSVSTAISPSWLRVVTSLMAVMVFQWQRWVQVNAC